jgi:hypothetical protein
MTPLRSGVAADLARRARWLERYRRRIALVVGVCSAAISWFALPRWLGPDPEWYALLTGTLVQVAVDFALIVTTSWWEVQVGRAARAGTLPHAIVVARTKPQAASNVSNSPEASRPVRSSAPPMNVPLTKIIGNVAQPVHILSASRLR